MRRPSRIGFALAALLLTIDSGPAVAGESEPTLSPPASSIPRAALLHAADQALAGRRLVEAKDLLDRLDADTGADIADTDAIKLLRAEWLIAMQRSAEAWPLLAAIDDTQAPSCRKASAEMIVLLEMAALDPADQLAAAREADCVADPVFLRSLGRLHLVRERATAAVAAFRSALALQPANAAITGDLGVALIAAGEASDAVRLLSDLAARHPDQPDVRINLDYAQGMLGQRPMRAATDNDMFWSRRLQYAGLGAQRADRLILAEALLGQALLQRPRHDEQLWGQYAALTDKDTKGLNLDRP